MRPPILIAFALLLAACGVKLDLERDILDGAENAVVWMTQPLHPVPVRLLSITSPAILEPSPTTGPMPATSTPGPPNISVNTA